MVAAMTGNTKIVQLLLSRNADVNKHTSSGKTALDIAECGGYPMIATLLRQQCSNAQPDQPTFNIALPGDEVQEPEITKHFDE